MKTLIAIPLLLAVMAAPVCATWSIILIDTRTGEIAVASATCLTGFDLKTITPVLLVGRGAALAQATVNFGSISNRALIWSQLQSGTPPQAILAALAASDPSHQQRQYGIVDVSGAAATFSGSQNLAFSGGVTGMSGTIAYAIQGNILTGQPVVTAAEQAVLNTVGDLPAKLMAAMEAARMMGGDGRCSCTSGAATSCGSPPANFTKSSHIGFMMVAREGDVDGQCTNPTQGCANGSYFLDLNVAFQTASAQDPVLQLQTQFNAWRMGQNGRPDHYRSTLSFDPPTLVADGQSSTTCRVSLIDWQGNPLTTGGANITAGFDSSSSTSALVGPILDNGDGTYEFTISGATSAGSLRVLVSADDGAGRVLLGPAPLLEVRNDSLWGTTGDFSVSTAEALTLTLDAGTAHSNQPFAIAVSASGTSPGIGLGPNLTLPLNPDPIFFESLNLANTVFLQNTLGVLDAQGQATAVIANPGANFLSPLIGTTLNVAFATLNPIDFASNAWPLVINP